MPKSFYEFPSIKFQLTPSQCRQVQFESGCVISAIELHTFQDEEVPDALTVELTPEQMRAVDVQFLGLSRCHEVACRKFQILDPRDQALTSEPLQAVLLRDTNCLRAPIVLSETQFYSSMFYGKKVKQAVVVVYAYTGFPTTNSDEIRTLNLTDDQIQVLENAFAAEGLTGQQIRVYIPANSDSSFFYAVFIKSVPQIASPSRSPPVDDPPGYSCDTCSSSGE